MHACRGSSIKRGKRPEGVNERDGNPPPPSALANSIAYSILSKEKREGGRAFPRLKPQKGKCKMQNQIRNINERIGNDLLVFLCPRYVPERPMLYSTFSMPLWDASMNE